MNKLQIIYNLCLFYLSLRIGLNGGKAHAMQRLEVERLLFEYNLLPSEHDNIINHLQNTNLI